MAYVGLTRPVIAVYKEQNGAVSYENGSRFGKAVKYEISPNYEDVSDYQDINETDPAEEIRSVEITLETSQIPEHAEAVMFGYGINGDETIANQNNKASPIGLGIVTREVIAGTTYYVAYWVHKVLFREEGRTHETKGDTITYTTPSVKGTAVPDYNGNWRTKKRFTSKAEADAWIDEKAGI